MKPTAAPIPKAICEYGVPSVEASSFGSSSDGGFACDWHERELGLLIRRPMFPSKLESGKVENWPPNGTAPESLLYDTSKADRKVSFWKDEGISPVKPLWDKFTFSKLCIPDKLFGILPDNWLFSKKNA
ncbi:hypothetical protein EUGRSUZ_L00517 [Eucalyptus grandis]|uniref:Uncharacterized protein n=2 Tax=Eucalyptus grandis TaxID=71139 RepID=A0ACC3JJT7_EUCGR|nr:hypothetical protein EUGRSUZ_L00517 [Eucalyptus grandis]